LSSSKGLVNFNEMLMVETTNLRFKYEQLRKKNEVPLVFQVNSGLGNLGTAIGPCHLGWVIR